MKTTMYPPELVAPMRAELVEIGFTELHTPVEVEAYLSRPGTLFVVINSVCGCAAGSARPAVRLALERTKKKPDYLVTVFAGVDKEATAKVREYLLPYPPSSPSMGLFKDGKLVHFLERHHIEGFPPELIADNLVAAFETYC